MTEITKNTDIAKLNDLPEAVQRFILHWGDMGTTWGVNRTVAQIHALLFIMEAPLFKTISRVPVAGDRRDYYTAETDVWEVAKRIAAVRKAREIDPALETLTYCLSAAEGDKGVSAEQRKRLQDMADFTATMDRWYGQMQTLPTSTLTKLIGMGDRVVGLLNIGRKKS